MNVYRKLGDEAKVRQTTEIIEELTSARSDVAENRAQFDVDLVKAHEVLDFTCQASTALLISAGDARLAIAQLERSIALAPDLEPLRIRLFELYVQQGADDDAIRVLRERCDQAPEDAHAWLKLARFCMQRRRLGPAESALRKAIACEPQQAEGYALLSQVQMATQKNSSAAVDSARQAISYLPSAANYYILATALYHVGDREGSRAALLKAIDLEPGNSEFRAALERM